MVRDEVIYLAMCGRYHNRYGKQQIAEAFAAKSKATLEIYPSYNVAPQSFQPVVYLNEEQERELTVMRWGLVPFWSKDGKIGYSTINAKAETLTTSGLYKEAFKKRRCLVPASGFYEWMKTGEKTRQPYSLGIKGGSIFAFAGLWDRWKDEQTGATLETYTIITTDPNELVKSEKGPAIHDRMPAILAPGDYDRWLAPAEPWQLPIDLLRPFPAEKMEAHKVSPAVGNVKNNSPDLCEEVSS